MGGPPQERRDGDWDCPNCGTMVFASKDRCFKCGSTKNGSRGPSRSRSRSGGRDRSPKGGKGLKGGPEFPFKAGKGGPEFRPGDWYCDSCDAMNFASRDRCFKCSAPKRYPKGGGFKGKDRYDDGKDGGKGKGKKALPGDWFCPRCDALVFASRDRCFACGCDKPRGRDGGGRGRDDSRARGRARSRTPPRGGGRADSRRRR